MKPTRLFQSSLRTKFIVFLLISIIIPISVSILISYTYTKEMIKDVSIQENEMLIYQGSSNILNYIDRVNQASTLIYSNISEPNSFYNIIHAGNNEFLPGGIVEQNLFLIFNAVEDIHSIFLYVDSQDVSYYLTSNLPKSISGLTHEISIGKDTDTYMEHTHQSHQYGFENRYPYYTPENVITLHRRILGLPTTDILGTLSIDIKTNKIEEISNNLYSSVEEQLYIIDDSAGIIYSSEPLKVGDSLQEEWITELLNSPNEEGTYEYNNDIFTGIHVYKKLSTPYLNWTIIKRIPYESLYQDARRLTLMNVLVILIFLIISVIATIYISYQFTAQIKQLIRYINKVEAGQLDAHLDTNRTDEIGILSKAFHNLIQKLNRLVIKEYRLEIANKTNQLKTLQAQVNPHFLYNSLQSIGTLALESGNKKVYSLIISLSKMMRYNVDTNEPMIPLSEEINHIKAYLALQKQRFDEDLAFSIDIDHKSLPIMVPKMILQPLVENYFKHGFEKGNNKGLIRLSCKTSLDNHLEITVEDNGTGIEETKLKDIQTQLNAVNDIFGTKQTKHIGLINVLSRLQLYLSENARMILDLNRPNGLIVKLIIPLMKGDKSI